MTTINWTANNLSLWFVGSEGIPDPILWVGWQGVIHEYGWWLLIVMGVLLALFIYTKNLILAIMVTVTLVVNIWWIEYAAIPTVPMILTRAIFILLIAFVWLFLLQARRVSYAGTDT